MQHTVVSVCPKWSNRSEATQAKRAVRAEMAKLRVHIPRKHSRSNQMRLRHGNSVECIAYLDVRLEPSKLHGHAWTTSHRVSWSELARLNLHLTKLVLGRSIGRILPSSIRLHQGVGNAELCDPCRLIPRTQSHTLHVLDDVVCACFDELF
jgi:hypothetical protein